MPPENGRELHMMDSLSGDERGRPRAPGGDRLIRAVSRAVGVAPHARP